MNNRSETFSQIRNEFDHLSTIEQVLAGLERIERCRADGEISVEEAYELRGSSFGILQDLTAEDAGRAAELIEQELLPYCVGATNDHESLARYLISAYRDGLVDWLNQYHPPQRAVLRERVLTWLIARLQGQTARQACWTIAKIGFRDPRAVEVLQRIVPHADRETGDIALSTLVALGVPSLDRSRLLRSVNRRLNAGPSYQLIVAAMGLGERSSIPALWRDFLRSEDEDTLQSISYMCLQALTSIAASLEGDPSVQRRVWQCVRTAPDKAPQVFASAVYLNSTIAPNCNLARVVPDLLRWLASPPPPLENASYQWHLLSLRMLECIRPAQLEGWAKVKSGSARRLLRSATLAVSEVKGRSFTFEMHWKRAAWDVLIHAGDRRFLTSAQGLILRETNPYLSLDLAKRLACFRIPLSREAAALLRSECDIHANEESGEWARHMAVMLLAGSASSREAFQALLDSRLTVRGSVLQQTVDLASEAAVTLRDLTGWPTADDILSVAEIAPAESRRQIALGILATFATRDLIPPETAPRLNRLLGDDTWSDFDRSNLVRVIGSASVVLDPATQDLLRTWAGAHDNWLGWRSLEVLAHSGLLAADEELLRHRLGLQRDDAAWDLVPGSVHTQWSGFFTGLLYQQHPEAFEPAIVTGLRGDNWRWVAQALSGVVAAHTGPARRPLPRVVLDALLARAKERQSRVSAESEIFPILAQVAPEELVAAPWDQYWNDWLPEACIALANTLCALAGVPLVKQHPSALHILTELAQHAHFGVRRAALRALARLSPESLAMAVSAWARAGLESENPDPWTVEIRQRAAEASVWLTAESNGGVSADELLKILRGDAEPAVRTAADRATDSRRKRRYAALYLERVCAVQGQTNSEILSAWPYGAALAQIGDDESVRTLQDRMDAASLPPNVRHWLRRIIEATEEHWQKETRDWPEPWLAWPGRIEEGDGSALLSDGREIPVHYSLWQRAPASLDQRGSWGGALRAIPEDPFKLNLTLVTRLRPANGHAAPIAQADSVDGLVFFYGNGDFPG